MVKWVVLAGLLGMAVAIFALALKESYDLTNPGGYEHPRPPGFRYPADPLTAHGLPFENLELTTADSATIRGWFIPGPPGTRKGVVAIHGRGGDRSGSLPLLPMFHAAGASVLAVDLRENGLSDGAGRGMGLAMREAEDADRAVAELARRGLAGIALFGCSLGGTAAIIAGARNPRVNAVVAESPLASIAAFVDHVMASRFTRRELPLPDFATRLWGTVVASLTAMRQGVGPLIDAEAVVGQLAARPLLLIHGADDTVVPVSHAHAILARAGEPRTLWIVPGAEHCEAYAVAPAEFEARVSAIVRALPE